MNLFFLHGRKVSDILIWSEKEFRLYCELRHLAGSKIVGRAGKILCYWYGGCLLIYEDGPVRILRKGKVATFQV